MYRYVVYILYVVYSYTFIHICRITQILYCSSLVWSIPVGRKNLHPGIRSFVDLAAQLCSVDAAFGEAVRASPPGQNFMVISCDVGF